MPNPETEVRRVSVLSSGCTRRWYGGGEATTARTALELLEELAAELRARMSENGGPTPDGRYTVAVEVGAEWTAG